MTSLEPRLPGPSQYFLAVLAPFFTEGRPAQLTAQAERDCGTEPQRSEGNPRSSYQISVGIGVKQGVESVSQNGHALQFSNLEKVIKNTQQM